ncbi:MAG: GIY-YIG nuclease family protein [Bacteroidia bacterium]|nr:GIY-YIG nuclease family protein [Bacteroidia bacterium]
MMPHYVYIIYSVSHNVYYKGETSDPEQRLSGNIFNKTLQNLIQNLLLRSVD